MIKKKEAKISIKVELDENKIPESLIWSAPDGGVKIKFLNNFLVDLGSSK